MEINCRSQYHICISAPWSRYYCLCSLFAAIHNQRYGTRILCRVSQVIDLLSPARPRRPEHHFSSWPPSVSSLIHPSSNTVVRSSPNRPTCASRSFSERHDQNLHHSLRPSLCRQPSPSSQARLPSASRVDLLPPAFPPGQQYH